MRTAPYAAAAVGLLAIAAAALQGPRFGRPVDGLDLATASLERVLGVDADMEPTLLGEGALWADLGFRAASAGESAPRTVVSGPLSGAALAAALEAARLELLPGGGLRTVGRHTQLVARAGRVLAIEQTAFDGASWRTELLTDDVQAGTAALAVHPPTLVPGTVLHRTDGTRLARRGGRWVRLEPAPAAPDVARAPMEPPPTAHEPLGRGLGVRIGGDVADVRGFLGSAQSAAVFRRLAAVGASAVALDVRLCWARPGEGVDADSTQGLSVPPHSITLEGDKRLARAVDQAHASGLRVLLWPALVASPSGPPLDSLEGRAREEASAGFLAMGLASLELASQVGADAVVGLEGRMLPTSSAEGAGSPSAAAEFLERRTLLRAEWSAAVRTKGVPALVVADHDASLRMAATDAALGGAALYATRLRAFPFADGSPTVQPLRAQLERSLAACDGRLTFATMPVTQAEDLVALRALDQGGDTLLILERWIAGDSGGAFDLSELTAADWAKLTGKR